MTRSTDRAATLLRRRALLGATAAGALGSTALAGEATARPRSRPGPMRILQPGSGPVRGRYVRAKAEEVLWGRLPNRDTEPVAVVRSATS